MRAITIRIVILAVLAMTGAQTASAATTNATLATQCSESRVSLTASMDWIGDLLERIRGGSGDSEDEVGDDPYAPLPAENRQRLADLLDEIMTDADDVLYELGNVGTADTSSLPDNLPDMAALCVVLAEDARLEGETVDRDEALMASRMKTIQWLITTVDGYRDLAGISTQNNEH